MNDTDIIRLRNLLEKLNDFLHQPLNFEDKENVIKFAKDAYPEINYFYYDLIPKLLPSKHSEE